MHTMLWDTGQQPQWVQDLLKRAADGDASAKKELRDQISERVRYYVRDRAKGYGELDVLNEVYHQPRYLNVFGVEGIADIYAEVGRAVEEAGADTKLYVNEFNVFQWSQLPAPFGKKDSGTRTPTGSASTPRRCARPAQRWTALARSITLTPIPPRPSHTAPRGSSGRFRTFPSAGGASR
jgi:hypothetical protein